MLINKLELQQIDIKNRNIYLYNEIDEDTIYGFMTKCNNIITEDNDIISYNKRAIETFNATHDEKLSMEFKQIPDVNIYVCTPGGICYLGNAICDTIEQLNKHCKVNVTASGFCMSMGVPILLAVPLEQRFCTSTTTFMIHQVSGGAIGKVLDLEDMTTEVKRLNDLLFDKIINNTAITKEMMDDIYIKKKDWIIPAQEALELKLISKII